MLWEVEREQRKTPGKNLAGVMESLGVGNAPCPVLPLTPALPRATSSYLTPHDEPTSHLLSKYPAALRPTFHVKT